MRRTFIIVGAVVIILLIGIAIYFLFFNKPAVSTTPGTLPGAGTATNDGTTNPPGKPANTPVTISPRLVQISTGPVVRGAVVVNQKPVTASSTPETTVSYIDRQSGNVFSYSISTRALTRTSNKTIPGIQSASWFPDGSTALVRYLSGADSKTINTYALSATSSDGFFLAQDLADVMASPLGVFPSILSLASGVNGSTASLQNTNGTRPVSIFTTPLSSLRVAYAGKQYLAYTKPSGGLTGDAFLIDTAGNFSRIAGPLNGLVALPSPQGKWVLVSYTRDSVTQLQLVNAATSEALDLPVATIADKCVWAADDTTIYCGVPVNPPFGATYPDDWYQGAVHFADRIWKIEVAGRYAQLVLDFSNETKTELDAEALAIDPAASALVFVNKNDSSLWSYSL